MGQGPVDGQIEAREQRRHHPLRHDAGFRRASAVKPPLTAPVSRQGIIPEEMLKNLSLAGLSPAMSRDSPRRLGHRPGPGGGRGRKNTTGEMTAGSVMTFRQAGRPLAKARSSAGTMSAGRSTNSP